MKKLLVVKVGGATAAVPGRPGDFEDWILEGMQVERGEAWVVDVRSGAGLPSNGQVAGVVVPGSHASVTDREPWSERTAVWLGAAVTSGTPVLGICYGHQLLAHALGGQVADNPAGRQYGTVEVLLNGDGQADPLLGGLGATIRVQALHRQSVVRLPPGAQLLAGSARDPHQAFRVGERAWGLQFHPEFDVRSMAALIAERRQELAAEGQDPDGLLSSLADTPWGTRILSRFRRLVEGGG
ncbi:MAG: glutamine amidotransferase [Candidatus Latescibacterota bacterium]